MDSETAQSVLTTFLHAFSRLDLTAMLDCFASDATAFFPVEHHHTRLEGREAIGTAFMAVLNRLRAMGKTSLPLEAEDLSFQEWDDTAVATFHLRGEHLSRRTVVLQRRGDAWQIVHLHASNAAQVEG